MKMTAGGFSILRQKFGPLSKSQVDGINHIVTAIDQDKSISYPQAAYMLATTWHETNRTMQPITEYGNVKYFDKYDVGKLAVRLGNTDLADGDGFKYRGRGFVQITGLDNYQRFSTLLNIDLINNPDLALDPNIAAKIMIIGMKNGMFTGKKLSDYIYQSKKDYISARRIINGTDKALLIAGYADTFEKALRSW
ncbi:MULTISPECIES: glycoside hydrolase family 19 protein [Acinetobacter]|uniref:glycoside hydrolase family 19 protein n=1 Tax=Acinetobacter TaxID=469 RepID=UPI00125EDC07|nr:glycoside hydrolase family 19 protein [Acinetobacter guerrae]